MMNLYTTDYVLADKLLIPKRPIPFWGLYSHMSESAPKADIFAEDTWHTINIFNDLNPAHCKLPNGPKYKTVAIRIDGILTITHGSMKELADLHLYFKTCGDPDSVPYTMQIVETDVLGGQRVNAGRWIVPDDDGNVLVPGSA